MRRAGGEQRSPKIIKTHRVEPDGAREKILHLPGEISMVRTMEKSAEAVVAKKAGNAAGAKGRRTPVHKAGTELDKQLRTGAKFESRFVKAG